MRNKADPKEKCFGQQSSRGLDTQAYWDLDAMTTSRPESGPQMMFTQLGFYNGSVYHCVFQYVPSLIFTGLTDKITQVWEAALDLIYLATMELLIGSS